jgi:hypothetical protein
MSTYAFQPKQGPIVIRAEATGPNGTINLNLALDTAATLSLIRLTTLLQLGFDSNQPLWRVRLTTGSAVGTVPVFALTRFSTLGQVRFGFP